MLRVLLCRLCGMVTRVVPVTLGGVSVVGRRLVITGFVMPGGLAMVASCMFVVLGCLIMMFCRLLGHVSSLEIGPGWHGVDCAPVG